MKTPYADDLALALELADKADKITSKFFRSKKLKVETKPDMTPVTEADRATEQMIIDELAKKRPEDKILGEEFGGAQSHKRRWIIDPIDGTKNYARGIPVYATLIALEENGKLVVAVVSAPQIHKRWWATRGGGAWSGNERLHVSAVDKVENAFLAYGTLSYWQRANKLESFFKLHDRCARQRGLGDFWIYVLVAEGAADIAVEPTALKIWDVAAPALIVEEAGGTVTDMAGGELNEEGSIIATNGLLHKDVLHLLK